MEPDFEAMALQLGQQVEPLICCDERDAGRWLAQEAIDGMEIALRQAYAAGQRQMREAAPIAAIKAWRDPENASKDVFKAALNAIRALPVIGENHDKP